MQAYLINPAARTVSAFEFSGVPRDLCDILHTNGTQSSINGVALEDRPDTKRPDVIFVAKSPARDAGFFMVAGIPMPIGGLAVVVGMATEVEADDGVCGGTPLPPTVTLEWVKNNVLWLERSTEHDGDESMAFKAVDSQSMDVVANVLKSLSALQKQGVVDLNVKGDMPRYLN